MKRLSAMLVYVHVFISIQVILSVMSQKCADLHNVIHLHRKFRSSNEDWGVILDALVRFIVDSEM